MTNINQSMIFAAGYGKRMDEMTKNRPKPLVEIDGMSLIERLILNLINFGIEKILVNSHYLAEILEEYLEMILDKYSLRDKIELKISYEPELLNIGGAIKKKQKFFDSKPFFGLNSDSDIIYFNLGENLTNFKKKLEEHPEAEVILTVTEIENIGGLYTEKRDFSIKNGKIYSCSEDNLLYTELQLINNIKLDHIKKSNFSIDGPYIELAMKDESSNLKYPGKLVHIEDENASIESG